MRLVLDRASLLFDQHPQLKAEGLPARCEVRLRATMADDAGVVWASEATFLSDEAGQVDLDRDPPLGGTYFGLSPRGLFWSMARPDESKLAFARSCLDPLVTRFELSIEGETVATAELTRHVSLEGLSRRQTEHGVVFEPVSPRAGLVLIGSGMEGFHEDGAALLASHGYATLMLPRQPELDLVLAALDWPHPRRLFLVGSGRGGEQALLVATRRPGLAGVVSFCGSGLVFPGWTEHGKPLDGVPLDHSLAVPREPLSTRKVYAEAVVDRRARDRGRIPVEKCEAPLLLISAVDDQVWPSSAFSELVNQRLLKLGYDHPFAHLTFDGAGHLLGPEAGYPHRPTSGLLGRDSTTRMRLAYGGNPSRQAHAQRESWQAFLAFLETHSA
ncbi:MAG: acyl-CoA thioesterase/bile acid-CoA:amino acid N-acyltransferase family protein [Vulcanimicrobiota bacterium]